jgi:hypothetical protein
MISRAFTLCVPFVGSLAAYWKPLPMVALGIPTVLVSISSISIFGRKVSGHKKSS